MMDEEMDAGIIGDQPLTVDFMSSSLPNSFRHQRTEDFQFALTQIHRQVHEWILPDGAHELQDKK